MGRQIIWLLAVPNSNCLPTMTGDGPCHCTLLVGKTSSPVAHRHVEDIWYVLEGEGKVWREASGVEEVVRVSAGTSLTIPRAPHSNSAIQAPANYAS